jgi:hypothetical protein
MLVRKPPFLLLPFLPLPLDFFAPGDFDLETVLDLDAALFLVVIAHRLKV